MTLRQKTAISLCCTLFAITMNGICRAQDNIVFEQGIEYSNPDNQHLQVNMARPKEGTGLFPAILCIHGGGFRAGHRDGYNGLINTLAQNGYVAFTVSYRLAPKYQFPAAVYDTKAAVRWVRANAAKYHIDPNRIGVTGGSAGGHLVQFLGVTGGVKEFEGDGGNPDQSSSVTCVVNYYGPSDFTQSYGHSVDAAEVLPLWLGGDLKSALYKHVISSPLNWVTPSSAPTLFVHGTKDNYVAYDQALWIYARMRTSGVHVEMLALEGAGHGFSGENAKRADEAMLKFFAKYLKPGR